jgi:enoyl-CoA hydratase/carnithine racemase
MTFDTIRVTSDGPLGRLTLNRPGLNALGATALQELAEAVHCFDRQPESASSSLAAREAMVQAPCSLSH